MKAIALNRHIGGIIPPRPSITLFPDSALTVARQPLFLPGFADKWAAEAGLAFRITRLGKTIAPRFARRYYDAVTVALRAIPLSEEWDRSGALTSAFDGALTLGTWIPIADTEDFTVEFNSEALGFRATRHELLTDESISAVSTFCTIKSGDAIIPAMNAAEAPLLPRTSIIASINGCGCLALKIR